ncbi:hypothetical protein [Rubripirellula reticaptiva]|uniref:Uncharacterized protein n=1 Tax=Rubripirellula reticaptiva TaxID=2528013 RepID=A0A5C6ESM0_9BACT|nr:hypothetical protein [Rubripirellula reticaptiva]TWU51998.1 hypothetical protein Poly59_35950 [Rubripirellula reticaptiva]
MKFNLKSLLVAIAMVALLIALLISRETSKTTNREATMLAPELYRRHLLRELEISYGAMIPPGWKSITAGTVAIIDLSSASGRADPLDRIEKERRISEFNTMENESCNSRNC